MPLRRNSILAGVAFLASFSSSVTHPQTNSHPAASKSARVDRQKLQAQAKQILDAETAREKAGDCPTAQTTADFNQCFGDRVTATNRSFKQFEAVIRQLFADDYSDPAESATLKQALSELDGLDRKQEDYRNAACAIAHSQFEGGSGAASFELQCQLKLTRNYMRELDMIYGEDLHL